MRAQAARSPVNPELSHGCSQSFALYHPTTDKVNQTVWYLFQPHTPPSRFHAAFCILRNTLGEFPWKFPQNHHPYPVLGSFTAERWGLGSVNRVDYPQMLGNDKRKLWYAALWEEVVLCCSSADCRGTVVQMCVYLWVKRGEEKKDKTFKIVIV